MKNSSECAEKSFPVYGIIPARQASSRFPGKPLADIWGYPMFWHVYTRARQASQISSVILATDSKSIQDKAKQLDVPCIMTRSDHRSGTDRVYEAAKRLQVEPHAIIINIQGDEPALESTMLDLLIFPFREQHVQVSTLATPISLERMHSPHQVKVVTASNGDALYFSRAPIPYCRDEGPVSALGHIGIYAFRMEALERFVSLPPSSLEETEKLEQLRFLENRIPIRVIRTQYQSHGVDTPEDLEVIRKLLAP